MQKDFIEYMDYVDTLSDYDPYVDRFIWTIDGASDKEFPDNVAWYRKKQYYEMLSASVIS